MTASAAVPVTTSRRLTATASAKAALLIGLAIFAQEISWNFYDSQVPVSLGKYITSVGVVGFLMGVDNLLGIITQPLLGRWSDNLRTRWGRRTPFILVGMPLAALFFALIPFETSLPFLLAFVVLYVSAMLFQKTPTESLMPDFVPPEHRSKGNAILKTITSLTVVFAALLSMLIVDQNLQLAFLIPAVLMVLILPIFLLTVKEKTSAGYQEALRVQGENVEQLEKGRLWPTIQGIVRAPDKSMLYMLLSVFFLAFGWAALRALLTRYGTDSLGMTRGDAGGLSLPGGIAFLLLAYPLALLSERYGRRLLMMLGLALMIASLVAGYALASPTMLLVTVVFFSIGYATFSVNALVVVWNLASSSTTTGTFTGLFYLMLYGGYAVGPGVVGLLTDLTGWGPFLLNVAPFILVALLLLSRVRREGPVAAQVEG
ncbi:MAG: MFS transporter [Chloroflexi bacterium]|nr:MAG: MFS transporter [Chloroflexota bacterium]